MTDEEILTKRLSDWKPETDIVFQKVFGKFVEEGGELLEILGDQFGRFASTEQATALENELSDTLAFSTIIVMFANGYGTPVLRLTETPSDTNAHLDTLYSDICVNLGMALSIVGRCQIQGIRGKNPETGQHNVFQLGHSLQALIDSIYVLIQQGLDRSRIEARRQAKIDSKLPWIMGTATDLLPST